MNITKGIIAKAQKVVIYGPEGIGKSSLASQFPDPLFIDTEGSTSNMDVVRMDKPTSWTMLLSQVDFVKQSMPCKTLIIDTVDWAERLCIEFITTRANKDSITKFGYGEGFIQLEEEFGRFLNKLSDLTELGINVVLTAHAKINKFEQPDEMGAYDRWELKLGNKTTAKTAPLTKEWADMVLFCNYKTLSVATDDKGKKFKGQGGKRVIYTTHHPAWDAKNRFGLPEELDMSFTGIAHIFAAQQAAQTQQPVNETNAAPLLETAVPAVEHAQEEQPAFGRDEVDYTGIPQNLLDLMQTNNVLPQEIMMATSSKGYYPEGTPISNYDPGYIDGVLVAAWPQVFNMIQELRQQQQF
ncbi:ATP-binding protein [Enterococcus durans]|uniref:ATP-binding protein n=1 Tax=Enterococcus durans TaxID=53345 RepID=UPI0018A00082|nr:ATP-binding protein [Enterococcus durans]MDB1681420.1 ATP-binding protein [Enterococcus durans]